MKYNKNQYSFHIYRISFTKMSINSRKHTMQVTKPINYSEGGILIVLHLNE